MIIRCVTKVVLQSKASLSNGLFHDLVIVIITSQTVVSERVENVSNVVHVIYPLK